MEKENRERLSLFEWIVSLVLIVAVWLFLGGRLTSLFMGFVVRLGIALSPLLLYFQQHLHFLVLLAALAFFIFKVVRTPLRSYVSDSPTFRWPLFFFAFGVWIVAITLFMVGTHLFSPTKIAFSPPENLTQRLLFMALALVITPLQSFAEELLFRISLWRMMEKRLKSNLLIALISGLFFTLFHLSNLEVTQAPVQLFALLYYFMAGFLFMLMTTTCQGGEAAIGAHVANNLFLALFVNYQGSSLMSDAWFILGAPPVWGDLLLLIICGLIVIRYGKRIRVKDEE